MKNKEYQELAVCGFAAVKALEKEHPDLIQRLYFTADRAAQFGDLCRLLSQKKIPYNKVETLDLEKLSGSVHHQGVVAMIVQPQIEPLTFDITAEWVRKGESAVLLDRVGNANNLGAIVRSAAFFGIENIIIPLDEAQSSVTTSSYRVAQGGMEYVHVYSVRSAVRLLQDMEGKMIRFGTDVRGAEPVSAVGQLRAGKPALVVLGNEEAGISPIIRENCDHLIIIPSARSSVESLNVAQAASIILYELAKK